MIILITGASHTGKTLLAQKMLEKYKYPYLSIDHLKMGLIRCLAMSENYIENHFGEIIGYESEIEARMIDADCTKDSLKADNRDIINGFQHAGEQVVLIYSDYEQTIKGLLDRQSGFGGQS